MKMRTRILRARLIRLPDDCGSGERYGKFRPVVDFAGNEDVALVCFDDSLDQTQAQTQSSLGATFVAAIKARPYLGRLAGRNATAGVAETDDGSAILGARGDDN